MPFDVYSMRQAIEEGFILDVLQNYTPYKVAFRLAHEGAEFDDREVERSAALKRLTNTKEQFANSPDLNAELLNAIMSALDAHTTMSTCSLECVNLQSQSPTSNRACPAVRGHLGPGPLMLRAIESQIKGRELVLNSRHGLRRIHN